MADIPKIRFKGFTEPWEQRKLGEVLKERTERAKGDEELLSVTIANGVIRQIDSEKRNTASEDRSNYKIVKKGDVPYNSMRMWQGAVGNSKYNGIVSPAYTILTPTSEANGKFFMELFKKKSTLQIFQRWSQGLTSDTWNLKYPILSSIQFAIPSVEEQEKIAEYFSSLDHLITLHQRKYFIIYNKLITWEQRKLEAVLSLLKDGTHGTHQDAEEGPYLLSAKNIKNGQIIIDDSSDRKISEDEFNQIHTKFTLENGDILLTIVGSIGESAILESAGKFTFQRSVAFLRPSEEMTSRFLKTEIESVQFQKELNDRKSQSAQPGVYLGDLSKIPIYITSKEEQKKIGKYFSHLDNLITLHRRAL